MAKINKKLIIQRLEKAQKEIKNLKPSQFDLGEGVILNDLLKELKLKWDNQELGILTNKKGSKFSIHHLYCKHFMMAHCLEKILFNVGKTKSSTYKFSGITGLPRKTTLAEYQIHFSKVLDKVKSGELDDVLLPENSAAYYHIDL